jgi:D-alanyl-D-alanine carboxypeptidase
VNTKVAHVASPQTLRAGPARAIVVAVVLLVVISSSLAVFLDPGPLGAATGCGSNGERLAKNVCAAPEDTRGAAVLSLIKILQAKYSLRSVTFGVWQRGRPLVTGAVGSAYPGFDAAPNMHIRIGNTTETFETTLLLQLVQKRRISLSDPLSKWFPSLPDADKITVAMLARSTSGYYHYVKDTPFIDAVHADPFKFWTPQELVDVGVSHPLNFAPGTSWSFSDTNFVLLGEILRIVGGKPVATQIATNILGPLGLHNTQMTTTAYTPTPTLHGYTSERGFYEDDTFWSPSWATYTGDMTSTLGDMGRWAQAVGTGSLLSKASHATQFAPVTAGLGPLTSSFYYGMGGAVANGWVIAGAPGLEGFTGAVAYLPSKGLAVVIFTTANANAPDNVQFAPAIFNEVGALLAPRSPPNFPAG